MPQKSFFYTFHLFILYIFYRTFISYYGVQTIKITADYYGYTPNLVYIKKDILTRFIIDGKQLSGCNNSIIIPSLNIEKELQEGENIIEFTPNNVTSIDYSCWMGIIGGSIEVIDDLPSLK